MNNIDTTRIVAVKMDGCLRQGMTGSLKLLALVLTLFLGGCCAFLENTVPFGIGSAISGFLPFCKADSGGGGGGGAVGPQGDLVNGKAEFDAQCALCHGANGEGAALDPTPLTPASECTLVDCADINALTNYHEASMPLTDPSACVGDCALDTAAYIISFHDVSASGGGGGEAVGKADYDAKCASCHGPNGEGTPLDPTPLFPASACTVVDCADLDALTAYHEASMPLTNPADCTGACAAETAQYIMSFSAAAGASAPVGKAEYDAQCATCHGANGEGAALDPTPLFPASACTLVDCADEDALTAYHEATMPFTDPTMCVAECARNTAKYVMSFSAGVDDVGDPNAARFAADCSECHGPLGEGTADFFPQAIGPGGCLIVADCSDVALLTEYIEANMPEGAAETCVGECAMQTAMFISTLDAAAATPPVPADDPAAALVAEGRMFYDLQCALCHGPNGEGVIGAHETPLNGLACALVESAEGCNDAAAVEAYVIATMPEGVPADCVAECATATAALIVSFGQIPLADVPPPVAPPPAVDDPAAVVDDPAAVVVEDPAAAVPPPVAADDPAAVVVEDPAAAVPPPVAADDPAAVVVEDPAAAVPPPVAVDDPEAVVTPPPAADDPAAVVVPPIVAEDPALAVEDVADAVQDPAVADDVGAGDLAADGEVIAEDPVAEAELIPGDQLASRAVGMSNTWSNQCATCHVLYGETADVGKTKCDQIYCGRLDRVTHYIDRYMPLGNPDGCIGECAKTMAILIQQNGNVGVASMLHEVPQLLEKADVTITDQNTGEILQ